METFGGYIWNEYIAKFKSYYVVWKLGIIRPIFAIKNSLNRTM